MAWRPDPNSEVRLFRDMTSPVGGVPKGLLGFADDDPMGEGADLEGADRSTEGADLETIINRLRTEMAKKLNEPGWNMAGYFSTLTSKKIKWRPEDASQSEWVLKNAADTLKPAFSNMTNRRANLARQKALSCDLTAVDVLKCKLQEETHVVYTLRPHATVSGLNWRKVDSTSHDQDERLVQGGNLDRLADDLSAGKTVFTEEEWDAFGIKDLQADHVIKSKCDELSSDEKA